MTAPTDTRPEEEFEAQVRAMLARRAADVADDGADPALPTGIRIPIDDRPPSARTRWLAVAAAIVLVIGLVGLVARTGDDGSTETTDATSTSAPVVAPSIPGLPQGVTGDDLLPLRTEEGLGGDGSDLSDAPLVAARYVQARLPGGAASSSRSQEVEGFPGWTRVRMDIDRFADDPEPEAAVIYVRRIRDTYSVMAMLAEAYDVTGVAVADGAVRGTVLAPGVEGWGAGVVTGPTEALDLTAWSEGVPSDLRSVPTPGGSDDTQEITIDRFDGPLTFVVAPLVVDGPVAFTELAFDPTTVGPEEPAPPLDEPVKGAPPGDDVIWPTPGSPQDRSDPDTVAADFLTRATGQSWDVEDIDADAGTVSGEAHAQVRAVAPSGAETLVELDIADGGWSVVRVGVDSPLRLRLEDGAEERTVMPDLSKVPDTSTVTFLVARRDAEGVGSAEFQVAADDVDLTDASALVATAYDADGEILAVTGRGLTTLELETGPAPAALWGVSRSDAPSPADAVEQFLAAVDVDDAVATDAAAGLVPEPVDVTIPVTLPSGAEVQVQVTRTDDRWLIRSVGLGDLEVGDVLGSRATLDRPGTELVFVRRTDEGWILDPESGIRGGGAVALTVGDAGEVLDIVGNLICDPQIVPDEAACP